MVKCTIIFHMHTIYFCHSFGRKMIILNHQYDKLIKKIWQPWVDAAAMVSFVQLSLTSSSSGGTVEVATVMAGGLAAAWTSRRLSACLARSSSS